MLGEPMRSNLGWTPDRWNGYNERYPNTPRLPESSYAGIRDFLNIWERIEAHNFDVASEALGSGKILFVLVRGIFGNLMPGNFVPVLEHFRGMGLLVIRPRTYVVGTVAKSAARLRNEVHPYVQDAERIVWLCQSRGGLDALWALSQYPELRNRTAGVVLVQTPSAASAIMQSVLTGCYAQSISSWRTRVAEKVQKTIFTLAGLRDGCEELMSPGIDNCVATLQDFEFPFPVLAVATWSIEPTSWVDSYHKRLGEIRPGCAHDGQFYLQDQLWHFAEQLVLARIDHAQSVMGGSGFDLCRFWTVLATMLLERSDDAGTTRNPRRRTQSPTEP
jgi:pimeloyl-ACP methyl ester carboxylesterase